MRMRLIRASRRDARILAARKLDCVAVHSQ